MEEPCGLYCRKSAVGSEHSEDPGQGVGGDNPEVLIKVYKGLIRAHLEWGAVLFAGSTRKVLKALDRVRYQALRTYLGCMRTTPIPVLLSEAGEPPLKVRRDRILKRFSIRIFTWRDNPLGPRIRGFKEKLKNNPRPARYLSRFALLEAMKPVSEIVSLKARSRRPGYYDYSWNELSYDINSILDLDAGLTIKSAVNPDQELQEFLKKEFDSPICIYTDGAHPKGESVGASSFCIPVRGIKQASKLYNCFLALSAELYAIHQALKYVLTTNFASILICTDSQSALIKIKNRVRDFAQDPILHEIVRCIILIREREAEIKLMWIPSHSGIKGNEEADYLAKLL